jgi:hypothetical protein
MPLLMAQTAIHITFFLPAMAIQMDVPQRGLRPAPSGEHVSNLDFIMSESYN